MQGAVTELSRAIDTAGVIVDDLHAICLSGGSSRVKLVAEQISQRLRRMPEQRDDPKAVVVKGALTALGAPPLPGREQAAVGPRRAGAAASGQGAGWQVPAEALAAGELTMFRGGPARTGEYPAGESPPGPIRVPWTKEIGGDLSSPAVADGRVYVASSDGYLYSRKARTGKSAKIHDGDEIRGVKWRVKVGEAALGKPATPAVLGGMVYAGGTDGYLYAVNAMTGEEAWRFPARGEIVSSPAVAAGVVYVTTSDARLYAVGAADGERRSVRGTDGDASTPAASGGTVTTALVTARSAAERP